MVTPNVASTRDRIANIAHHRLTGEPMANHQDMPLFNLKAVVTETGLKPDTLRAWERRYGLPTPTRTPSDHRLYSQNDIDLLHWLLARQSEGLSISRAVEMRQRMMREGNENGRNAGAATGQALPSTAAAAMPHMGNGFPPQAVSPENDDILQALRGRWVDACLRYDEQDAEHTLSEAFALFTPEMVCLQIIQRGLATIGEGWYRGRVTVQQEHFASSLALRRLEAILNATPPPTRAGRILIACPPGEEHTFVPLLLALLLRRRGWDTVYLGANVPLQYMETTIGATRPQLVVLTAQQLSTAAAIVDMGNVLLRERIPLAYGGVVFSRLPQLHALVPGHYLGDRLENATARIEGLMPTPRAVAAQQVPTQAYRDALAHYVERQPRVEAAVWDAMRASAIPTRMVTTANHHFGRMIEAALSLGNIDLIAGDMEWLDGLLVNHAGMPRERTLEYLAAYLQAARTQLGAPGAPLIEWLATLAEDDGSTQH